MKKTIDEFRTTIKSRLGYDDINIEMLQSKLDSLKKEISSLEPQKKRLVEEKALQESQFVTLKNKLELDTPKEIKIKEIENRKDELARYLKNAISSLRKEIIEKERRYQECSNSLKILSSKSQVSFEMKEVLNKIDRIRTESKDIGEKIAKIRGQLDIASKLKIKDGKCPVCNSEVKHLNPLFEEDHLQVELDSLNSKIETLERDEITMQDKKKNLDFKLTQIAQAESIMNSNSIKGQDDLIILGEEISALQNNVKEVPHEISTSGNLVQFAIDEYSSDMIKTISTLIEETKDFDPIKFRNLKRQLEEQNKLLNRLDQEIVAINTRLEVHREDSEKNVIALEELNYVRKYVSSLETIRSNIYNRDGPVATSLRSWTLGIISQRASEYLSTFNVNIQRISLEDKARDIGITCYSGNSALDLESLSGGERVSVALALRLGMAHLMGTSNLSFIILDEPTTHLDQERRKSLVNVLSQAFESNTDAISQFIIITHDSEIFENSNIDAIYDFKSTPEGTLVTPI